MHLVSVSIDSINVGQPLPFSLRDAEGTLLAQKGYVIKSRAELDHIMGRGFSLYIDIHDSESHHRAYLSKLHNSVIENRTLGDIASIKLSQEIDNNRSNTSGGQADWLDLQVQVNALLRDTTSPNFTSRLERLYDQLEDHAQRNPNGALFALFHLSASEIKLYSATHAMLVSVMCGLAAREVLNWSAASQRTLGLAALTMNIGMTDLQDRLAMQISAPSPEQRRQIDLHAARSVQVLTQLGIEDKVWLEAVRDHHAVTSGPLANMSEGRRLARMIQRADMFAARLAPRASRVPTTPAAAMQACYFDENRQVDEAGAALIKAVGIYSPGSFVRLVTNEIAIVIQRGVNTATPKVAVLINREGIPTAEPMVRDTALRDYRIVASVPHREVKLQIHLPRMLPLTAAGGSDRRW